MTPMKNSVNFCLLIILIFSANVFDRKKEKNLNFPVTYLLSLANIQEKKVSLVPYNLLIGTV